MKKGKTAFIILMIVLNIMVLMGQIYPEGAPPFARVVNIVFLVLSFVYFVSQARSKN